MNRSSSRNFKPFQMLSDGDRFVIVEPDRAIVVANPYLANMNMSMQRDMINATSLGGPRQMIAGNSWSEIDIHLVGGKVEVVNNFKLEDLNLFSNISIRDLLKMVDKRVSERE